MPITKALSKGRFILAIECPTKVHYSLDSRYVDGKQDDELMQALANGGFQVGALAKAMYLAKDSAAEEIQSNDQQEQIRQTAELLKRQDVTIFEATIRYEDLLIRIDILEKHGEAVNLIEVKAKSWDPNEDSLTNGKDADAAIDRDWMPYVYDIAFQHHVLSRAYPTLRIRPWLMLVDKSATNTLEGLALKFPLRGSGRSRRVEVLPDFNATRLTERLLHLEDASAAVQIAQTRPYERRGKSAIEFASLISSVAGAIRRGEGLGPYVGSQCKKCEFYAPPDERADAKRSGWSECMETHFRRPVNEPREVSIFGFYDQSPTEEHLARHRLWMRDVELEELDVKTGKGVISRSERHELQWREVRDGDTEPFLNEAPLRQIMKAWKFPLHFIDFETAAPVLPFHAGQRPYQPILFQFSHHIVEKDGSVRHATECLISDARQSPSIAVATQLREAIGDTGTVLHWYPHERTILRAVVREIEADKSVRDLGLRDFLNSLGLEKDSNGRMFDMGRMVKNQCFLPGTGGSSSMKKFLPALLRHSDAVRRRYSKPVYGTDAMRSNNFTNKIWVVDQGEGALDPYQLLDPVFTDNELDEALELFAAQDSDSEFIANGAKAMIAYGTLQDPAVAAADRDSLRRQLLAYCELDTFAMVMVFQALQNWLAAKEA